MTRIVQISDTHLSPSKAHFEANWPPLAAWIARQEPALVIHTGDVTVDGADQDEDLAHCAALLRDLGVPFLALPGNHDVGDPGHRRQPTNESRIARWRRHFGPDRWFHDIESWRLVGFDAMLIGSGEAEERRQADWLGETMAGAGGRRLAWFLHRPLFLAAPDEGPSGYWAFAPALRFPLLDLVARHRVGLVASGHLHKAHEASVDGVRYVWSPSSAFVCGPATQEPMPGEARLGAVLYDFAGDEVSVTIAEIPGLTRFVIDEVLHEVYPPHP